MKALCSWWKCDHLNLAFLHALRTYDARQLNQAYTVVGHMVALWLMCWTLDQEVGGLTVGQGRCVMIVLNLGQDMLFSQCIFTPRAQLLKGS